MPHTITPEGISYEADSFIPYQFGNQCFTPAALEKALRNNPNIEIVEITSTGIQCAIKLSSAQIETVVKHGTCKISSIFQPDTGL